MTRACIVTPFCTWERKNLPISSSLLHQKFQLVLSAQPNTWFIRSLRVHHAVTSGSCGWHPSSCRAQPVLPPGLSLYPGLLSLCDIQLGSPLLALLYSAASCFVVHASVVTRGFAPCSQGGSCQQDLQSLQCLLRAPLLLCHPHMATEAPQGKRDSCKMHHLNLRRVCMCVCVYLFI